MVRLAVALPGAFLLVRSLSGGGVRLGVRRGLLPLRKLIYFENNAPHFPYLLVKLMVKSKQLLVALSKAVETIREGDYEIIQSFMGRINI